MGITTVFFIAVYGIGIILTLRNPFYGIMLYIFEWHNHPPYWWWGESLPDLRWSFFIVLLILISIAINRNKIPQLIGADFKPLTWLILMIINVFFVTQFLAVNQQASATKAQDWFKLTVYYFLIVYLLKSPKEYRWVIWVILLCIANFGKFAFEEGSHRNTGLSAPGATGGNPIAVHIMATLPFLGIVFLSGKKWEKIATILIAPLALNEIILEDSRGAFVGLLSMAVVAIIATRGKLRFKFIFAMALGVILFLNLTNQQFWDRMNTIFGFTGEEENGIVEEKPDDRIFLWRGAVNLLADYPAGVGGSGFNYYMVEYVPELAFRYREKEHEGRACHNTILNVATEWGIQGLILYLGFLIHSFILTMKTKRDAPLTNNSSFYYLNAIALQMSVIGIIVAGLTHNFQYMEITIWICAFSLALRNMQKNEIAEYALAAQTVPDTLGHHVIPENPQTA